jgi:hypothetical protein
VTAVGRLGHSASLLEQNVNRWPPLLHFAALSLRETLCVGQGVEEMTNALDNTIGLHNRTLHYDLAVKINYLYLINEHCAVIMTQSLTTGRSCSLGKIRSEIDF